MNGHPSKGKGKGKGKGHPHGGTGSSSSSEENNDGKIIHLRVLFNVNFALFL